MDLPNNPMRLWNCTPEEIDCGYRETDDQLICVFCGECFGKDEIVRLDSAQLVNAHGAMKRHITALHGDAADVLLAQNPALTGISDIQQQVLRCMVQGKTDAEIARELGIALSTVRNHRFRLREKEKQAQLFLAMMRAMQRKTHRTIGETDAGMLQETHLTAAQVDDRYDITEQERTKTLATYFDAQGALRQFPAKEKKKIIVLMELMKQFHPDQNYSEKEVNRILKRIFDDYATIRRYLIEYGFLERKPDGSVYRVKA